MRVVSYWKKLSILATVAALVVAVLALQPAAAGNLNERISGSFIDTSLDLAGGDGVTASSWSGRSLGSGFASYDGLLEIAFTAPTGECGADEAQTDVVVYSMVRRYANGDLRVSELVGGFGCFDPVTGIGSVTVDAEFTGGTGRYANASGTYRATFDLVALQRDTTGGIAQATFDGHTSSTS